MYATDVFDTITTMFGAAVSAVDEGTSLGEEGLHLSSLDLVRLLVGLEERFDIELDDVTIMNSRFESVGDLVHLVGRSLEMSGRIVANAGATETA